MINQKRKSKIAWLLPICPKWNVKVNDNIKTLESQINLSVAGGGKNRPGRVLGFHWKPFQLMPDRVKTHITVCVLKAKIQPTYS